MSSTGCIAAAAALEFSSAPLPLLLPPPAPSPPCSVSSFKLTVNLILHCLVGQVHHPANARGQAIYHLLLEIWIRSEEHTSELQSRSDLVCRLLLEKKKKESTQATNAVNTQAVAVTSSSETG